MPKESQKSYRHIGSSNCFATTGSLEQAIKELNLEGYIIRQLFQHGSGYNDVIIVVDAKHGSWRGDCG